jgi:hypothetical protein
MFRCQLFWQRLWAGESQGGIAGRLLKQAGLSQHHMADTCLAYACYYRNDSDQGDHARPPRHATQHLLPPQPPTYVALACYQAFIAGAQASLSAQVPRMPQWMTDVACSPRMCMNLKRLDVASLGVTSVHLLTYWEKYLLVQQ